MWELCLGKVLSPGCHELHELRGRYLPEPDRPVVLCPVRQGAVLWDSFRRLQRLRYRNLPRSHRAIELCELPRRLLLRGYWRDRRDAVHQLHRWPVLCCWSAVLRELRGGHLFVGGRFGVRKLLRGYLSGEHGRDELLELPVGKVLERRRRLRLDHV